MWKLLVAVLTVGVLVLVVARLRTTANRARFLQQAGLVLMAIFTLVGVAWIAAEMFSDPGGWRAGGLVAMWFVPLAILLVISWYRVAWRRSCSASSPRVLSASASGSPPTPRRGEHSKTTTDPCEPSLRSSLLLQSRSWVGGDHCQPV